MYMNANAFCRFMRGTAAVMRGDEPGPVDDKGTQIH